MAARRRGTSAKLDVIAQARRTAVGAPPESMAARYGAEVEALGQTWERERGESDLEWALFRTWRDLPAAERSYAEVARRHTREGRRGRDPKAIRAIAARRQWTRRAADYDRYVDRVHVAQVLADARTFASRLSAVSDVAVALVAHELGRLLTEARSGAAILPAQDLVRIAELFARVGTQSRLLPEHLGAPNTAPTADGTAALGEMPSGGFLSDDPDFRAVILAAQARITAARTLPSAIVDVHPVPPTPDPADPDDIDDELDDDGLVDGLVDGGDPDWDEDDDTDPLTSMDESDDDDEL